MEARQVKLPAIEKQGSPGFSKIVEAVTSLPMALSQSLPLKRQSSSFKGLRDELTSGYRSLSDSYSTQRRLSQSLKKAKGNFWNKLHDEHYQKKLKMFRLKRRVRIAMKVSLFLRAWWQKHLKSVESMVLDDEDLDIMSKLVKPEVKKDEPQESFFDVASFKADRQQKFSREARRILTILPRYRTENEIHYLMIALRSHKQIANYPVRMQKLIASYGFLECYNEKRAIIRQGHPPNAFYYIFYGRVAVTIDDYRNVSRIERYLGRGDSFGELAIINQTDRKSSVISDSEVELVSISREVYEDVFTKGGTKKITDPDHDLFIRNLDFLKEWPIQLLEIDPEKFIFTYFQRGAVIVQDSAESDWLYVVKSGSVNVLKKLVKVKPEIDTKTGKKIRRPKTSKDRFEAFLLNRYKAFCLENGIDVPSPTHELQVTTNLSSDTKFPLIPKQRSISAQVRPRERDNAEIALVTRANTVESQNQTNSSHQIRWRKTIKNVLKPKPKISLSALVAKHVRITDVEETDETVKIQRMYAGPQEFVPVEPIPAPTEKRTTFLDDGKDLKKRAYLLTPADINPQFVKVQNLTKGSTFGLAEVILGQNISLCLVSNGAECLMINKEFYRNNCPESLLRRLLKTVSPYPEDDTMQENLLTQINWNATREATLSQVVDDRKRRDENGKAANLF